MILDTKNCEFNEWSIKRRMRFLHHLDLFIRKDEKASLDYDTYWTWHGVGNKTKDEIQKWAEDDSKFIQALWAFSVLVGGDSDLNNITIDEFN